MGASPGRGFSTTILNTPRHHESSNPSHMAAFPVAESLHPRAHRSLARRHLPSPVDVDLDIGLRRAGNPAGDTADRGGADACRADTDGLVDGDGNRALRTVLLADGSVARSRPEITGVCGRRIADLVRRRDRAGCMVVRLAVDALAVLWRVFDA